MTIITQTYTTGQIIGLLMIIGALFLMGLIAQVMAVRTVKKIAKKNLK